MPATTSTKGDGAVRRKASASAATRTSKRANGGARAKAPYGAYDEFKEFEGKRYTGMKVGRGHKWKYDPGEWTEKKVTPDKWEFRYSVTKRRSGKAPEGSGVPVGTEYHWYILAHQTARKLDANSYSTDMVGMKYKLAHKRADKETWSATDAARRNRLVRILEQMIASLKAQSPKEAKPQKAGAGKTLNKGSKKKPSQLGKRAERRTERHLAAA